MKILTDEQAEAIARFLEEYVPDAKLNEEDGWPGSDTAALDSGFVALVSGEPMLQIRLSGFGPTDGEVVGPLANVELYDTGLLGIQRGTSEEWEELNPFGDAEVSHVFIEVAGTEPMGGAA